MHTGRGSCNSKQARRKRRCALRAVSARSPQFAICLNRPHTLGLTSLISDLTLESKQRRCGNSSGLGRGWRNRLRS